MHAMHPPCGASSQSHCDPRQNRDVRESCDHVSWLLAFNQACQFGNELMDAVRGKLMYRNYFPRSLNKLTPATAERQ